MITRTSDPAQIEHRLLELAYTTDVPITASALAYFAPCSLDDAEQVLDDLVTRDRLRMDLSDDGAITYALPNRHRIARPDPEPTPALIARPAPLALRSGHDASPLLAAVLSMIVPGAGQLYAGNALSAMLWFLLVTAGYFFLLPGVFLHLFCIASAAGSAHRLNSSLAQLRLQGR